MWVIPWQPVFVPTSPSRYLINDNKFSTTVAGPGVQAIYLLNDPSNPWIDTRIWNNSLEPQQPLSDGIDAYNTKGAVIWDNTIDGTGYDAIGLYGSTFSAVIGNNVSKFTPDSSAGLAQIYLDPSTTHDLVVCAEPSDTVLNQGTNNIVIRCQQQVAASVSVGPAIAMPQPNLPKGKPFLH